jgi:hypothetical protein
MIRVIDTNVPIVANGRNTNATPDCRLAAISYLMNLLENGRIVLDTAGEIQDEYHRYLNPRGQPGVGDRFYLEVLNSSPQRVKRVNLPKDPATGEFVHFPADPALRQFDPSDRKFAAAARKVKAQVVNATDSDWLQFREPLAENGIGVEFVCGCDPRLWHESSVVIDSA